MKKFFYILTLAILILILISCKLIQRSQSAKEDTLVDNMIYSNPQEKGLGEIESIIEYGHRAVIGAHFPIFEIDHIDSITRDMILSTIHNFKTLSKDSSGNNENYKSELNIDYRTYEITNNIVGVEFTILEDLSTYSQPDVTTITKTYDLKNKKPIQLEDIYLDEIPIIVVSSQDTSDIAYEEKNTTIIPGPTRNIDPTMPMVALTFDDGPNKNTTIPILNTLKEYESVATFFVLGNRVPGNEHILRRMHSEGSEIGNHSFNHKRLTTITSSEVKIQVSKTQDAIMEVVGTKPKLMRPTYGSYNDNLKSQIEMPMILWSIDTLDWKSKDAEKVANHVLNNIQDGDIVLMHDIYGSTADAVKVIVPELVNRGYQLVTVSELYESRGETLQVGNIYNSFYKK